MKLLLSVSDIFSLLLPIALFFLTLCAIAFLVYLKSLSVKYFSDIRRIADRLEDISQKINR